MKLSCVVSKYVCIFLHRPVFSRPRECAIFKNVAFLERFRIIILKKISESTLRYDSINFAKEFPICVYSYVYLGAACLPLNVVENQTTVGRKCRLEIGNATGHSWRTSVKSATKEIRHSRISAVATHNNFVSHPPTQRRGPSGAGRKTGRRTPEFFSLLPGHRVINPM